MSPENRTLSDMRTNHTWQANTQHSKRPIHQKLCLMTGYRSSSGVQRVLVALLAPALVAPALFSAPVVAAERAASYGIDLTATQWGLTAVRAQEAWTISEGEGVTVAVLDTGVDGTHPDLAGRVLPGWSTLDNSALAVDQDNDSDQHGTHVATIIGGDNDADGVAGLAPKVTILPVQVLGSNGGTDRTVAAGIDWAVANGADIINLSLGGAKSIFDNGGNISCTAVGRAFDAGVVVIVAAGNSGSSRNPENRPASCRGALSVAALDENLERTFFSSYDATVGIAAPGRRIVAGVPTAAELPYAQWDGTSMAAPYVAAAAALLRSAHPEWTATEVVTALRTSAVDVNSPGFDPETGSGALDAAAALGLPARTLAQAKASIHAVTVPRILSAASDALTTSLRWEAPVGAAVKSYRVSYVAEIGQAPVSIEFAGDKLAGSLAVDAFLSGFLTVTAITSAGERVSMPFNGVELAIVELPEVPQPKVTKLTARWVDKGIEFNITTDGPAGTVNATALDWNYGLLGNTDVKVKSGKKSTLLLMEVSPASEARAHVAVISAGVDGNRKQFDLLPQYPLAGLVLTSGPARLAVKGSSNFVCLMEQRACAGEIVELRDAKSRKVLGSTRVLENLEFTIMINRLDLRSEKLVLTLKGKNASPILPVIVYKPTANGKPTGNTPTGEAPAKETPSGDSPPITPPAPDDTKPEAPREVKPALQSATTTNTTNGSAPTAAQRASVMTGKR